LERVDLSFRQTLQTAEEPNTSIHFPENGYLSRLAIMDNGDAAEIGLISAEGMTGIAVLLGDDRDSFEIMVQVPGPALSIGLPAFRTALAGCGNSTVRIGHDLIRC
jgi:hypothetical protein